MRHVSREREHLPEYVDVDGWCSWGKRSKTAPPSFDKSVDQAGRGIRVFRWFLKSLMHLINRCALKTREEMWSCGEELRRRNKGLCCLLSATLVVRGFHLGHWRQEAVTPAPWLARDTTPVLWQGDGVIKPMCSFQQTKQRTTLKGHFLANNGIF